jgi:hypothetical protein
MSPTCGDDTARLRRSGYPLPMLDPRIYRSGLVVVALAAIVCAFSLRGEPGPLGTTLSPGAFNGQNAYATMTALSQRYPSRQPGSAADAQIAGYVARSLSSEGFTVSRQTFRAQTVDGPRTLQTVFGVRVGLSNGTIVVVAHRDAVHPGDPAELSGTGVLLELGRVLAGQTPSRSIVLASTSGSAGAAGAAELARTVPGPVDAVIALGDLAAATSTQPIVVPWSNAHVMAPSVLRNTLTSALAAQAGVAGRTNGLASQFLHLSFPLAGTEQAPFAARGAPAVLVSLAGDRAPSPREATSESQIDALGRSVLSALDALDNGPQVPGPSAYLLYSGQEIPAWAIRLLVLALILPVLAATVDGLARARRRGHAILPWIVWVLSAALPFVLAALAVRGMRLVGLIDAAPPGPLAGGALPLHGRAIAILAALACLIVLGLLVLRPGLLRLARSRAVGAFLDVAGPGAASALLLALCAVTLSIWWANPFAAALLIPALHLWLWAAGWQRRLPRTLMVGLLLGGLLLPVLALLFYAGDLGLSAPQAAWSAVLLLAGGGVSLTAAIQCSILVGCGVSMTLIALRAMRQPRREPAPVTVRGPVSYAGPGSLGGTGSALRR